jgi:hypothetical protein
MRRTSAKRLRRTFPVEIADCPSPVSLRLTARAWQDKLEQRAREARPFHLCPTNFFA